MKASEKKIQADEIYMDLINFLDYFWGFDK